MIKKYKYTLRLLLALSCSNIFSVSALEINELQALVEPCFDLYRLKECRGSLTKLEDLQMKAVARENYACQTRLLGLQTDLMLIMNNPKRKASPLGMIKEVKRFC